jgi:BirA family biotin operon repressor/biotin-[acetyl-CoA-carboxylase] ligase
MRFVAARRELKTIEYETVDSTNTAAFALARAGENGPLWVKARKQTCGRGRRGRAWVSEPGNLHASLLLSYPGPPDRAPELSFVAALAVHDALSAVAPQLAPQLTLKWPNDVLCNGKKICGILVEAEGRAVVIGIGINCIRHPQTAAYPATDLASAGAAVSAERMFSALAPALLQRIAQWNRGTGFAAIRADWLAHAAGLGDIVCVRTADTEIRGRHEGIDDQGRLRLQLSDGGCIEIAAGEVIALAVAGARAPHAGA